MKDALHAHVSFALHCTYMYLTHPSKV